MCKVISLSTSVEYQNFLQETKEIIKEAEDDLFVQAINLCCASCWRAWNEGTDELRKELK